MRVAVTGSSGQLGTVALRRLAGDRRIERVVAVDLAPPSVASRKVQSHRVDVRDRRRLTEVFAGCDAVVHLAFAVTSQLPREVFEAINVGGSENVFEAALAADVRRIVYASSIAAYGVVADHPDPIVESTPRICQEDFPYSAAKYRVEEALDRFEAEHPELHVIRLRPSILIGRTFGNPLGRSLARALRRGVLPVTSEVALHYVWDEDVAAAAHLALTCEARGAFNLCAGAPMAPRDLARELGLRCRRVPPAAVATLHRLASLLARFGIGEAIDPSWSRQTGVEMRVSSERARAELGWQPRCPEVVDVFRRYLELAPGNDRRLAKLFRFLDFASRLAPATPGSSGTLGPVHLCLLGPGGGDFTLEVREGRLRIAPGVPAPPASSAILDAALWRRLLAGETTFPTAEMTGKVRLDGDPSAAFLVPAILTRIRQQCAAPGLAGRLMRARIRRLTRGSDP